MPAGISDDRKASSFRRSFSSARSHQKVVKRAALLKQVTHTPRIEDLTYQFRSQSFREKMIEDVITKDFDSQNYRILMFNFLYAYVILNGSSF